MFTKIFALVLLPIARTMYSTLDCSWTVNFPIKLSAGCPPIVRFCNRVQRLRCAPEQMITECGLIITA